MKTESIRQRKIADQIKKNISQIIDRKLKDPRKGFITITQVKITRDLKIANIYFTCLGDEEQRRKSRQALESANKFIRSELAPLLKLRFMPELRFFYDETLDYARHVDDLLKQIHSDNKENREEE
jgi:ribosome-binding factor A